MPGIQFAGADRLFKMLAQLQIERPAAIAHPVFTLQ